MTPCFAKCATARSTRFGRWAKPSADVEDGLGKRRRCGRRRCHRRPRSRRAAGRRDRRVPDGERRRALRLVEARGDGERLGRVVDRRLEPDRVAGAHRALDDDPGIHAAVGRVRHIDSRPNRRSANEPRMVRHGLARPDSSSTSSSPMASRVPTGRTETSNPSAVRFSPVVPGAIGWPSAGDAPDRLDPEDARRPDAARRGPSRSRWRSPSTPPADDARRRRRAAWGRRRPRR